MHNLVLFDADVLFHLFEFDCLVALNLVARCSFKALHGKYRQGRQNAKFYFTQCLNNCGPHWGQMPTFGGDCKKETD